MTNYTMSKNARLEARIMPDIHALIKRAAEIQGRTLSDFVVSAARDATIQTIEQTEVIYLSRADQKRFAAELIDPAPLSPAMERAFEKHKELVGSFRSFLIHRFPGNSRQITVVAMRTLIINGSISIGRRNRSQGRLTGSTDCFHGLNAC